MNGPEVAVLPLESALILGEEPVEVMEQHPVEDGLLGLTRAVDSLSGVTITGPSKRADRTEI